MSGDSSASGLSGHLEYQLGDACLRQQMRTVGLTKPVGVQPMEFNPNNAATLTVERVLLDDGSSVVRKVLVRDGPVPVAHWATGTHPAHWNHWRREIDAYLSGAVEVFEPFVSSPEVLGRLSPSRGIEVLFLDDVPGPSGEDLDTEDLAAVARQLGRAQGQLLDPQRVGRFSSASREWIWAYATSRPPGPVGYLDTTRWSHPVVVDGFGDRGEELRRRFGELTAELPLWRRVLAACPRTFCHLDFWSRNLVMTESPGAGDRVGPGGAPVLVDWSFAGLGAVGEDPGNLVPDVMVDHQFHPDLYHAFDERVSDAYLAGLSDSAWPHDPRWARLAMCVAVLKFVWLPAAMVASADHSGPTGYAGAEGPDLREVFSRRAAIMLSMLERTDEARRLTHQLGLRALLSER